MNRVTKYMSWRVGNLSGHIVQEESGELSRGIDVSSHISGRFVFILIP
jgi:hypothetical protein